MQVVRCARGELGSAEIRGGRKLAALGPVGAIAFYFDLATAGTQLPLAQAVREPENLEAARQALADLEVTTELDYERTNKPTGA
jgi:hypothetical protein